MASHAHAHTCCSPVTTLCRLDDDISLLIKKQQMTNANVEKEKEKACALRSVIAV